jgi:hypothetical protein
MDISHLHLKELLQGRRTESERETLEVPQLEGDLESETRQNLLGTLTEASE